MNDIRARRRRVPAPPRRPPARRGPILVSALLALISVVGAAASVLAMREHSRSLPTLRTTGSPIAVPVLSARRAPEVLSAAVSRKRLQDRVAALLADPARIPVGTDYCVIASEDGRVLFEYRGAQPMLPASTLKLLTATAALAAWSPDERFRTSVNAAAPVREGIVAGDLWLIGGGDPLLATADYLAASERQPPVATSLESLADGVVAGGVRVVEGSVVGDDRRYDDQRVIPTWKRTYVTAGEVGPLSALSINDGFTSGTGRARRAPADPPTGAAQLFASLLQERGVTITGAARSARTDETVPQVTVSSIDSPPLRDVVAEMLRESDNNTAELLVKEVGFRVEGRGTTEAGLRAARGLLVRQGLDVSSLTAVDGSGLDRGNRASCALLLSSVGGPRDGALVGGLALAGETGTLRHRFTASAANGRLLAKTGTLNAVSALAGVLATLGERRVNFAVVFNGLASNGTGIAASDDLVEAFLTYPEGPAAEALAP